MPLSATLAAAFRHIASEVSNLNDVQFFDRTIQSRTMTIPFDGRRFTFVKLGFSQLNGFVGIDYAIRLLKPNSPTFEQAWTIWLANPVDAVAVNRRAVVAGIYTIIDDPNTGKVSWTLEASHYVAAA